MELMLPSSVKRVVPDWFARSLRDIDTALSVYFNPLRERWVIDRCTKGDTLHSDHTYCPRTNVRVVQDEDGSYMPLCQSVLDGLKASDVWTNHGGGEGLLKHLQRLDDNNQAKLRKDRRENTEHVTRDNRITLNKAAALADTITGYELKTH